MKTTLKIAAVAALATISLTAAAKLSEGKAYGDWKGTCQGSESSITTKANRSAASCCAASRKHKTTSSPSSPCRSA